MYTGVMCSSVLEKGAVGDYDLLLSVGESIDIKWSADQREKKEDHKSHRITFRLVYDNLELFYKSVSLT